MSTDAAEAIRAQAELGSGGPLRDASAETIGARAAEAGAIPNHVDVAELLSYIRDLQSRVEAVEDERRAERDAGKPDLVNTAELIRDHIAHRASALGKGSVLDQFKEKADKLVEAARSAVESGEGTEVGHLAAALGAGVARVATQAASADVSYPLQLITEDLPEVLGRLRAPSSTVRGEVLSSHTAAPPRRLGYQPVR